MTIELLIHSAKGGVGKSTLSILAAEYYLTQDKTIDLTDASGNPTADKWIQKCLELGRENQFTTKNPDMRIRDTKGIPNSALPFFGTSSLIIVPFQLFPEDVEESIDVFLSIAEEYQSKVVFVPNRLRALGLTKEQVASMAELRSFVQEMGKGSIVPGLIDRQAVYPLILNGMAKNFFESNFSGASAQKAQVESAVLFEEISKLINI